MQEKYIGILDDNRPKSEQKKNYDMREVDLGAPSLVTKEVALLNAQNYIFRTQWHKSSCVPSSICNALWNTEKEEFADEPWYSERINKPQEGCYWYDIADKALKSVYLRKDNPEVKTEAEANAYKGKNPNTEHIQKSYLFISSDATGTAQIISVLNSGIAVPFSVFTTSKEWSREVPKIFVPDLTKATATINHAICGIPNTGYEEDGEYNFFITDSSWFGKIHLRNITQTFFEKRWKHGVIFADLEKKEVKELTKYEYTRDLSVGSRGDDVKMLQINMRELGFLSSKINGVEYEPTTYFGGLTRQAVKDYQVARNIKPSLGYFGPITRKRLHSEMK